MQNKSDKIIWQEFKNEKEDALSFIYQQNVDFLFFYGKKFVSDEGFLLDIIQDLFFYLISKRKTLGDTENIRMYLLKSFRRRLFNEIKKRNQQRPVDDVSALEAQLTFSIEEKVILDEEKSAKELELKRGMEKLNAKQREVLYYRFTCGFDYNQICEIMSISYDSVRQIVSRSIQILKKYMIVGEMILFLLFYK